MSEARLLALSVAPCGLLALAVLLSLGGSFLELVSMLLLFVGALAGVICPAVAASLWFDRRRGPSRANAIATMLGLLVGGWLVNGAVGGVSLVAILVIALQNPYS
ncbi:MAG: hypothetical protein WD749_01385 [Phycisphaerales bacterium]